MNLYKHYSFDLWLTLIRSNPEFKNKRAAYFYKNFNHLKKTVEEVIYIFRQVDLMSNAINEKTGKNIDADEMYLMVISLINENTLPLSQVDLQQVFRDMEGLLYDYLPFVYCHETIPVLSHLKENSTHSLSILSNTGFIKGNTLRKVLKELQLSAFFDFQLYSDEAGLSKPSKEFFEMMLTKVVERRGKELINPEEIIHVGDNVMADIEGARTVGINTFLINSNELRIADLIKK
ncbi:HAD family hydrolase [Desertivirga arenae]|uniref:HAD family hydrolase n=1 Tax=Desertivirga arenae TaxID=2810309 RepID=UPI001A963C3F|nr:HAD family hydrolase [Pedobacter sp. SYSU D00823]